MEIKVKLDNEKYIYEYAEVGGLTGDDVINITVPNEYIIKTGSVEYRWDKKSGDFMPEFGKDVVASLSQEFRDNYSCMKVEDGIVIYDKDKKKRDYINNLRYKSEKIKSEIMKQTQQAEFYKENGWSTEIVDQQIKKLKEELIALENEINSMMM